MKAISLFSGIGGIDLACEWAGVETVAFCEREPFCQKVLKKHWPDVPIYDDVCTLTKERIEADGIGTVDLIHGGYPCQPFSLAGDRKGTEDHRHLWPEYFRLVQEIRPRWVVGENVAGHINLGLDLVLSDLESAGYTARPFVIPAAAVGALHRRERVFIVAYADNGHEFAKDEICAGWDAIELCGKVLADTNGKPESQADSCTGSIGGRWNTWNDAGGSRGGRGPGSDWWQTEPAVGRMVDGNAARLDPYIDDRLKALGNAVVPQQIYPIIKAIKIIDDLITF